MPRTAKRVAVEPDGADASRMAYAMELGERAAAAGDVPVGALLVVGDASFAGWNRREAEHDPTAHAEIVAIRAACAALGTWRLAHARLYVTKEPCVMCAGAIVAARIDEVVFGCADAKGGAAGGVVDLFDSLAVHHRVRVRGGVRGEETAERLRRFFDGLRRNGAGGRPI